MAKFARSGRRLCAELLEDRRQLAAVTVTTHLDVVNAGDGLISLREAIQTTNAASGADEIYFDASLSGKTIVLQSGQLQITDHLTINGPGADQLAISGNNKSRVLLVGDVGPSFSFKMDVTISGLTIKEGKHLAGAGIFSSENLTLVDSVVTNNVGSGGEIYFGAAGGAGVLAIGFYTPSTINITRSTISHNAITEPAYPDFASATRGYSGGGVYASGNVTITDSVITDNVAGKGSIAPRSGYAPGDGGYGGGIYAAGNVTIQGSVISRNTAGEGQRGDGGSTVVPGGAGGDGGGVAVFGSLAIQDTLISENSTGAAGSGVYGGAKASGNGGGVYFSPTTSGIGTLSIVDSSILHNVTADGKPGANYVNGSNSGNGGGLWAMGGVAISGSTFAGNSTGRGGTGFYHSYYMLHKSGGNGGNGGGVWLGGLENKSIINSTISDNSAGQGGTDVNGASAGNGGNGGGIWYGGVLFQNPATAEVTGELTIAHSTVANNSAGERGVQSPTGLGGGLRGQGGGVYNSIAAAMLTLNHSIVALNVTGVDAPVDHSDLAGAGQFAANYSLIGTDAGALIVSGTGNQIGSAGTEIDPLLGPLADNGGPTQTHALLAGSPALDAGNPALIAGTGGTPTEDQRGDNYDRIVGTAIDLGSFEAASTALPSDADFDGNAFVDGNDFLLWQRGAGDADGDTDSDGDDLQAWADAFGQPIPPLETAAADALVAAIVADEETASEFNGMSDSSWLNSLTGSSIVSGGISGRSAAVLLAVKKESRWLAFEQFRTAKTESQTRTIRLDEGFESLALLGEGLPEELSVESVFELELENSF